MHNRGSTLQEMSLPDLHAREVSSGKEFPVTEGDDMGITREQFMKYEKVRESGKTNMLAIRTVSSMSGLPPEIVKIIMEDYEALSKEYLDRAKDISSFPRIKIKKGWEGEGRQGILFFIAGQNEHLGQPWAMVLFDGDEDPDCHKAVGLEFVSGGGLPI